jgi:hypothetical protein
MILSIQVKALNNLLKNNPVQYKKSYQTYFYYTLFSIRINTGIIYFLVIKECFVTCLCTVHNRGICTTCRQSIKSYIYSESSLAKWLSTCLFCFCSFFNRIVWHYSFIRSSPSGMGVMGQTNCFMVAYAMQALKPKSDDESVDYVVAKCTLTPWFSGKFWQYPHAQKILSAIGSHSSKGIEYLRLMTWEFYILEFVLTPIQLLRSRILFPCQIYSCSLQKHPFSASWTPKTSSPHHVHVRVGTYVQRLLLVERQKLWLGGST